MLRDSVGGVSGHGMRASSVVSVVSVDTSCGLAEQCSVSGHGMRASSVVSVSVVSVDTARGLAVQCQWCQWTRQEG